jgi:tetratricopeptide (TPR) repeat protein
MNISQKTLQTLFSGDILSKIGFETVLENLGNGNTYQEMLRIPDSVMEDFYAVAINYFDAKQYAEAADSLLFLCALNPLYSNLWLKLGNAEYALNHPENALEAYSLASLIDPNDPFPHIYTALVFQNQNKKFECQECLNISLHLIDEQPQFESMRSVAMQIRRDLHKQ